MYFDANGNLTFSNFCTQQSHSGSVDTWYITYMGKTLPFYNSLVLVNIFLIKVLLTDYLCIIYN